MSDQLLELNFGMEAEVYPLNEKLLLQRGTAVFQSQLNCASALARDRDFLLQIEFAPCFYGACDCEIYPFVCVPQQRYKAVPTAAQILAELGAANFQSDYVNDFDARDLPFAGYHPATLNDEIHTDENEQYLFEHAADIEADAPSASWNSHRSLVNYVLDKHLFYVLIHDRNKRNEAFQSSEFVLLFALGVAPDSGNLVGAVSSQLCHNLCD